MYFLSMEVRWFCNEKLPENIKKLFCTGDYFQESGSRTDTYLIFPNAQYLGAKFREGNFELKTLVQDLGLISVTDQVKGILQTWEKWSISGEKVKDFERFALSESFRGKWTEVEKKRVLRKFKFENQTMDEIPAGEFPDNGCQVEITDLKVRSRLFWTLNLEAFGDKHLFQEIISSIITYLNNKEEFMELLKEDFFNDDNSMSYPKWLMQLNQN